MPIFVFGVNHQTAPVAVREQVALSKEQIPEALGAMAAHSDIEEALILSTCNRTEIYAVGALHAERQLGDWLASHHACDRALLEHHFYTRADHDAVRHTLRVASGLDSMVVGEPQILGQVKEAYHLAVAAGTTGKHLNKLMQYAFSIAKKVRTETSIGATPVSVAYAAVRLARQVHGDLNDRRALLIGAGDTIELVAQHLRRQGIAGMTIANRTLARAEHLARTLGAEAVQLADIPARLPVADIVVASATSRAPLVTRAMLDAAIRARREQPMFVVDLAVPRNVDPTVESLPDVYLYTVDDLERVITDNLELRRQAARQAEEMIDAHANSFMDWMQSLDGHGMIVAYRRQVEAIAATALAKAQRRLANGEDPAAVLAALTRALSNKLAHQPLTKIREAASEGRLDLLETARELLVEEIRERPE